MEEIQYKNFSLRTHKKNWQLGKANFCQFELTFRCALHCRHCYTDCYNKSRYLKKELSTKQVKFLLDKLYNYGVIWLCFSGGDPLTRKDFLEIYSYAKHKGFIITIFTNGYSLTKEISEYLSQNPPFAIEITFNAADKELYEKITQTKGAFIKVFNGIKLLLKANLPLKIKTQVTKDNVGDIQNTNNFIKTNFKSRFLTDTNLYARLNGDTFPCTLRTDPKDIYELKGGKLENCQTINTQKAKSQNSLFTCTIGGRDGFYIDPYGNTFPCILIRKPIFNLLKTDIKYALDRILSGIREKKFTTNSKCAKCESRMFCHWCPGKAYVETGDMEKPIDYYCDLTKLLHH